MDVFNLSHIPKAYSEDFGQGSTSGFLRKLAGSRKLCITLDSIAPGTHSTKYHAHTMQEEFFIIQSGQGMLRTKKGEQAVAKGDFFAKPAGLENPHTFYNSGDTPLQILDISTADIGDTCYYPDEDIYYLRGLGIAFSGGSVIQQCSSEPGK